MHISTRKLLKNEEKIGIVLSELIGKGAARPPRRGAVYFRRMQLEAYLPGSAPLKTGRNVPWNKLRCLPNCRYTYSSRGITMNASAFSARILQRWARPRAWCSMSGRRAQRLSPWWGILTAGCPRPLRWKTSIPKEGSGNALFPACSSMTSINTALQRRPTSWCLRPTRMHSTPKRARQTAAKCTSWRAATNGQTPRGKSAPLRRARWTSPWTSTRCMLAAGALIPTATRTAIASWPGSWCRTLQRWAIRM